MKLNHLDLQVPDVQALATFLADHFDFERASNPASPAIAHLTDRKGFSLVLQRRRDAQPYPDGFHIGFIVAGVAGVRAQHARLTAAGFAIGEITETGRGTMFYVTAPGDVLVEVSTPKQLS